MGHFSRHEVAMSNYQTKSDLKNEVYTGINSFFGKQHVYFFDQDAEKIYC